MQYQYGSYYFAEGSVELSAITRNITQGPKGTPAMIRTTHQCTGEVQAASGLDDASMQDDIRTKVGQIEVAFANGGVDCGLLHNDGSKSVHWLYNDLGVGGNRILTPPQFPTGSGAEYASYRTFNFAVYHDTISADALTLHDYKETVSFQGDGGPKYAVTELDSGSPDIQQVSQYSAQTVVQSGMAVGVGSYPSINGPIYGVIPELQRNRSSVQYQANTYQNGDRYLYPVSWNYVYVLTSPRTGLPTIR